MKKNLCIVLSTLLLGMVMFAQDYNALRTETEMILPDGAVADVFFFKKSADLNKFKKDYRNANLKGKKEALGPNGIEKENDAYLGTGNVMHNEEETVYIKKICDVMKECGAYYGIAYATFEKRTREYIFGYNYNKVGSLLGYNEAKQFTNMFVDFFDETHEFYIARQKQDDKKQKQLNKLNRDLMENNLITYLYSKKEENTEAFENALYRVRHTPRTIFSDRDFPVYFIYNNEGHCYTTQLHLVIDKEGEFWTYDYNDDSVRVDEDTISKDVKIAAWQSL